MTQYRKDIINAMLNMGIFLDDSEKTDAMLLSDLLEDSLMFISFILELEEGLNIKIPDEYLLQDALKSIADVEEMINDIID